MNQIQRNLFILATCLFVLNSFGFKAKISDGPDQASKILKQFPLSSPDQIPRGLDFNPNFDQEKLGNFLKSNFEEAIFEKREVAYIKHENDYIECKKTYFIEKITNANFHNDEWKNSHRIDGYKILDSYTPNNFIMSSRIIFFQKVLCEVGN